MRQQLIAIAVLAVLGIACFIAGWEIPGLALAGAAAVLATVAVFYAVGRSEDRDRARRAGP